MHLVGCPRNFSQMEAEILADDVRQHYHIQLENKPQKNRKW